MNDIIVSVCMITFNHEKYIRQAIDGILMQKTNFSIEIIIGEDCSRDNTREIVVAYAEKYPDIIRPLLPKKNLGMIKNLIESIKTAKGKYIAFCEGDDYWIDPYKLQKQVDILEEDSQIVGVVTNSSVCDFNGNLLQNERLVIPPENKEGKYNLHDFFRNENQYPTLTVVFRNKNLDYVLKELEKMSNPFLGDWILWVLLHVYGDFYYINQVTSSYRMNPDSVTHTVNAVKRWEADFKIRKELMEILPVEYHVYLKDNAYAYHMIGMAYRNQKKIHLFLLYQIKAFISNPFSYINIVLRLFKFQKRY